ncbi:MAG: LuxR C-terminal-related transcriptional regulator [Gammaproteobacteria bacterium]|nr:LuxR C-terminal-related transcriptional regulator [Gammaproteobacteria bacterium]
MKARKHGGAARAKSSRVGFLLFDTSFEPIYANDDAIQILTYPKGRREIESLDRFVAEQIRSVLFNDRSSPAPEVLSGRRRYRCQAFTVRSNAADASDATVVLFERDPRKPIDVAQILAQFDLTERERETARFLIEGLTNKEIAGHMNISPSTVKAFIRRVMAKMGVTTRSGIVGKIVKTLS